MNPRIPNDHQHTCPTARLLHVTRLPRVISSWLPAFRRDESGQALIWAAAAMVAVLASSAMAIDVAHALVSKRQLQASADASALAYAGELPNVTASNSVGQTYSGSNTNKNSGPVVLTGFTETPLCLSTVQAWGIYCASSGGTVTVPNAVRVTETASISTYFAGVIGIKTITVSATATASKGKPKSYNIAVIVDSTLSMNQTDSNCSNLTQEICALQGVQQLLQGLSTSLDRVALFTFPNISANSAAGVAYSGMYSCTSSFPSSNGGLRYPSSSGSHYTVLDNPRYNSQSGTSTSNAPYLLPYGSAAWAMPYTFPPIPTGTLGYTVPSGTNPPTYQVTQFLNDYNSTNSSGTVVLNTSSNLVRAVGGNSSCGGIEPSNYDGNYGTYYAGALYAAQSALLAEQAQNPQSGNVMIILGDGNSTSPEATNPIIIPEPASPGMPASATQSTTTYGTYSQLTSTAYTFPSSYNLATSGGSYPSWVGECGQSVDAAQYASTYPGDSTDGTLVYTIAYGALTQSAARSGSNPNGDCGTDVSGGRHVGITPCQTMQQMATVSSAGRYFYSDWPAQGANSGCQASSSNSGVTAINEIFNFITADLTGARLIPNTTQ